MKPEINEQRDFVQGDYPGFFDRITNYTTSSFFGENRLPRDTEELKMTFVRGHALPNMFGLRGLKKVTIDGRCGLPAKVNIPPSVESIYIINDISHFVFGTFPVARLYRFLPDTLKEVHIHVDSHDLHKYYLEHFVGIDHKFTVHYTCPIPGIQLTVGPK